MNQKTGNEHFCFDGMPTGVMLNDFWRWQASDLLNNTMRGALAEFIVAKSLGIETNDPRVDWEPYDLLLFGRWRIEVKASAYVQSWSTPQSADSNLRFTVRPTRAWTPEDGYDDKILHQSDMYIFCVLAERNKELADPLVLDQWEFYPVLTTELSEMLQQQKTAGLGTILRLCPERYDYSSLRDAVLWLMSGRTDNEAMERLQGYSALKQASVG